MSLTKRIMHTKVRWIVPQERKSPISGMSSGIENLRNKEWNFVNKSSVSKGDRFSPNLAPRRAIGQK